MGGLRKKFLLHLGELVRNRTDLRHGYNTVSISEGRWMGYTFDKSPTALPLEATTASGDSGGPMLIAVDDGWHVAGFAAWKRAQVNGTEIFPGRYGEGSYGVRLTHYTDWIEKTVAMAAAARDIPTERHGCTTAESRALQK